MKIALVTDRFDPTGGGLEQWTARLAAHLVASGHAVYVVAFGFAEHDLPIQAHTLRFSPSVLIRARRVQQRLDELGVDAVHDTGTGWRADVFQPQTGSNLMSLDRQIASLSRLQRLRAAIAPRLNWRRLQMRILERQQVNGARRIVAVSKLVHRELVARHGIHGRNIPIVYNGVDTERFRPNGDNAVREQERKRLGVDSKTLFAAAAHNLRLKGIDTALRALRILLQQKQNVHFVIAGGVPDPFWLRLTESLGLVDHVTFCGPVRCMETWFAAADVFVHPTRHDACSLATTEALACGLPVITTSANGAAEIIENGVDGFVLADPEDSVALAGCMQLLLDESVRTRIGSAARKLARQYDIRNNYRAVEALLVEAARC